MPNYEIDYEDERFTQVEADKQEALTNINNTYNNMINSSDQYYQSQIDAAKDYANTQQQIQQENTDFTIEQINQQKEQANKDYTKEQKGAYVDWQKQSNQYGANAEQMASNGLTGTGYSESSQVSMYNTYQNRVATARESYNKAVLNYDNAIKDAQLQNNSALAEIAYNALQTQLELSLQGFQYKNSLIQTQLQLQTETDERYYNRWQNVLNQMNHENQFAESVRQYNQNYELQQKQFEEEIRQFEQSYDLQMKQFNEDIRQFTSQMNYYREKDAQEYALEIKRLEQQREELQQRKQEAANDYAIKKQQLAQEQARWEKEFNKSQSVSYTNGPTGGYTNTSGTNLYSKPTSVNSAKGVSQKEYNTTLANIRRMTSGIYNDYQKRNTAEDMLARTNFSDEQIKSALKNLGIK